MTKYKSKVKFAAGVIIVFLVGVLAGVLGAGIYFESRIEKMFLHGPPRGNMFLENLTKQLDLSPAQVKEIRPIVQNLDEKSFAIKDRLFVKIKPLLDEARNQIRLKLNDEQKKKFDQIHEKMKKGFPRHPPPPFPPPPDQTPPKPF